MRLKFLVAACFCAIIISCGRGARNDSIDLLRELVYAEQVSDTQVIIFGTPAAKPYLYTGWAEPERQAGQPFQWAVSQNPTLIFNSPLKRTLYLHLRATSFFPNPAEVLINKHPIGTINVGKEEDQFTVPIPGDLLTGQANAIEFHFAELRTPGGKDQRQLAASFFHAVISPAKYMEGNPAEHVKEGFYKTDAVMLKGKRRNAYLCNTGTSLFFHEKLDGNTRLHFGTYFHPSPLSEEDDFTAFSVFLRRDGQNEQRVFYRKANAGTWTQENVDLSSFLKEPAICELEFRLERNSIYDSGQAAWIEPSLDMTRPPLSTAKLDEDTMETIRRTNRNSNVLIMLLDAGGAKHFGCYGYSRNTTPVIDDLARQSVQFNKAYCNAVYTLASTATLMSGLDPYHHRIILRKSRLPADTFTMAERFLTGGFATATIVANGNASSIFGMTQGFQEVGEVFRDPNYTGWAMDITNHFTKWLNKSPNRRFFAYLHYREPHGPFNPPPEWKFKYTDPNYHGIAATGVDIRKAINFGTVEYSQADKDYIQALYDANLNYADYEVGRVLKKLKELGIYDRTTILLTADHGEAFWEHGFQGHNSQLYEESIHIPLILKLADQTAVKTRRIDSPVRTIDYYPTLVDLMDLSQINMKVDGRSFLPYLTGAPDDGRTITTQTIMEQGYSFKDGDFKYMVRLADHKEELYNLKDDPGEKTNLIATMPIHGRYFRSRLFGWFANTKRLETFQKTERAVMDENTKENLKTLGYLDE